MAPQTFGKYELIKKIATGGMAEVWLANQKGIEGFARNVVVKRILPHLAHDPEFMQMFVNEAKIAARFSHPNIVQISELGEVDGLYFLAMEFIHGEDLGRIMRKAWSLGQWVSPPLALRIISSCCEGLHYAHAKTDEEGRPLKVVHRDVSPQNVLVSFDGAVKLVDFGIAKAAGQVSMTRSGAIKGKFAYMSPEQAAGKALDHRADIFSLGLVLYELLTGVRPLKRDSDIATLQAALECAIQPPSAVADVPASLDEVVMRALQKASDDRYRDARQFHMALEEHLIGQKMVASSVQVAELMKELFSDRLAEEAKLGHVSPRVREPSPSGDELPAEVPLRKLPHAARAKPLKTAAPRPALPPPKVPPGLQERFSLRQPLAKLTAVAEKPSSRSEREERAREAARDDTVVRPMTAIAPPPLPTEPEASANILPGMEEAPAALAPEEAAPPADPTPVASPNAAPGLATSVGHLKEASRGFRAFLFRHSKKTALVFILLTALCAFVFRAQLAGLFARKPPSGPEIWLNVESNLPVRVYARHPKSEGVEAQQPTYLGEAPLQNAPGAHVGDTIILENAEEDAYYEQEIAFGEPQKAYNITKEFRRGYVRFIFRPSGLSGISVFSNGRERARYLPGRKVEFYEGKHQIELRGDVLKVPIQFEIEVKPDDTVDISRDLTKNIDEAVLKSAKPAEP
jgi:serine/threonine protein kinase